ncbi:unnamed protein product [Symbiodinium natans]|uniref:Uncharacterized protein n=1 Tax=Symbiodinium natans TaxID=878477 RepID=A0A812JXY3_9DINO|nr:unnamed protein product [Symbiodinium natans]
MEKHQEVLKRETALCRLAMDLQKAQIKDLLRKDSSARTEQFDAMLKSMEHRLRREQQAHEEAVLEAVRRLMTEETSPADVPVTTQRPSPTSFNEPCDDEEVASATPMQSAHPEEPTRTPLPVSTAQSWAPFPSRSGARLTGEYSGGHHIEQGQLSFDDGLSREALTGELPVATGKPSSPVPARLEAPCQRPWGAARQRSSSDRRSGGYFVQSKGLGA